MPRHAHEDALSEAEFEQLVDGAKLLEPPLNLEALFTVFVAGRLGLRAGEIAHMTREWINYETEMIEIPRHSDCECGYCRRQARREALALMFEILTGDGADRVSTSPGPS